MKNLLYIFIAGIIFQSNVNAGFLGFLDNKHLNRGKDWIELGNYSNAIRELKIALEEEPKSTDSRYYLALSYAKIHSVSSALEMRNDLLSVDGLYNTSQLDKYLIDYAKNILFSSGGNKYEAILVYSRIPSPELLDGIKLLAVKGTQRERNNSLELLFNKDKNNTLKFLEDIIEDNTNAEFINASSAEKDTLANYLLLNFQNEIAIDYFITRYKADFLNNGTNYKFLKNLPANKVTVIFEKGLSDSEYNTKTFENSFDFLFENNPRIILDILFKRLKAHADSGSCGNIYYDSVDYYLDKLPNYLLINNASLHDLYKTRVGTCISSKSNKNGKLFNVIEKMSGDKKWNKTFEAMRSHPNGGGVSGSFDPIKWTIMGMIRSGKIEDVVGGKEKYIKKIISDIKNGFFNGYKKIFTGKYKNKKTGKYLTTDWELTHAKFSTPYDFILNFKNVTNDKKIATHIIHNTKKVIKYQELREVDVWEINNLTYKNNYPFKENSTFVDSVTKTWFTIIASHPISEKNKSLKMKESAKEKFPNMEVYNTNNFTNLTDGLYIVAIRSSSKERALKIKSQLKEIASDAYIKSSTAKTSKVKKDDVFSKNMSNISSIKARKMSEKMQLEIISTEELSNYSANEIGILRNSVFAYYGYDFDKTDYQNIFNAMPWYENKDVSAGNIWKQLSQTAKDNIKSMRDIENTANAKLESEEMKMFANIYQSQAIPKSILTGIPRRKLKAYRNTLFAYHGLDFSNTPLDSYFSNMAWHKSQGKKGGPIYDKEMSKTAQKNVQLIKSFEKNFNPK